ncbi:MULTISPECIES: spore germination lipoprotein GerD [Paenibacillus]|uniref:Spore gernimation protein n=1 Tax=Paenibacillus lignilyticus TaxID=1172615 RepID=A0ABS5CLE4_9BACL|nr:MULTISPECIES: spore germination lipoprotein GerD [Paenibacillus]MBP3966690.1 spore gernimation protein [Paenibacillus lignilyticus]SFT28957.1 spore germination protein D [Paenibacillus sp. BC26]
MVKRITWLGALIVLTFSLSSCGTQQSSASSEPISYKDMKSMVIDILKTEDAQKALQESASATSGNNGSSLRSLSVQDQEQVRLAVKETLVAPEYSKVIEKLMTDPRFAGEFAKAVNKQNKQIHKDLLKDPTYQKDLIQVMKSPEMDKMILEVLQSTQYRKQTMSLMQESMQNPLFRLEILDLLKKAVQEELKPKPDEKVTKEKEGGDKGGGEGGGEGEGEGGGEGESGGEGDSGMSDQGG